MRNEISKEHSRTKHIAFMHEYGLTPGDVLGLIFDHESSAVERALRSWFKEWRFNFREREALRIHTRGRSFDEFELLVYQLKAVRGVGGFGLTPEAQQAEVDRIERRMAEIAAWPPKELVPSELISEFGICQTCRIPTDVVNVLNVGRDHWGVCRACKTRWPIGSNLFWNWRFAIWGENMDKELKPGEYDKILAEQAAKLEAYKEVTPYHGDLSASAASPETGG